MSASIHYLPGARPEPQEPARRESIWQIARVLTAGAIWFGALAGLATFGLGVTLQDFLP